MRSVLLNLSLYVYNVYAQENASFLFLKGIEKEIIERINNQSTHAQTHGDIFIEFARVIVRILVDNLILN